YQMWAIDSFARNKVAFDAVKVFGLAGDNSGQEQWTQLMEHISGVTAIDDHLGSLLEKYGAQPIDRLKLESAALLDNLEKPQAVSIGIEMLRNEPAKSAALLHDLEKPAELAAARAIANGADASGLENSRDNPVLREGRLWTYLHNQGVSD